MHGRKNYLTAGCTIFCMTLLLQACVSSRGERSDTGVVKYQPLLGSLQKNQDVFAKRNPVIESAIGDLTWTIRIATPAEVAEDAYKLGLYPPAAGAGALALGLAAPPMFASALVVGGALLIPLGSYVYVHEKGIWDAIHGALTHAEITPSIDRAMRERILMAFAGSDMPAMKIEIVLEAVGLVKAESTQQHCFVAAANFLLSRHHTVMKQENLRMTDMNRSEGAPPPQCAGLEHFAKNGPRLVKDTLAEYAELLAAMAVERIPRQSVK